MFPLAGNTFPNSADELAGAARQALEEVFVLPSPESAVTIKAAAFPTLERIELNLDGAQIRGNEPPPPPPKPSGKRQSGVTTRVLSIHGQPIRYAEAELRVEVTANDVRLDYDRDQAGHAMLVLEAARDGHMSLEISAEDLQAALRVAATAGARQHGVAIQDLTLSLTTENPRTLDVSARVKAKKMMMSSVIQLKGRVAVDDSFNATLSGLRCTGEGFIGGTVAGFVQQKLNDFEGRAIPLTAFSLGDVRLRDLKIEAGPVIRASAEFGS